MPFPRHARFVLASFLLASSATTAGADARPRLAILDVQAQLQNSQLGAILTEIVTTEVAQRGTYDVVSSRDIGAMLGFERQKELAGCSDVVCIAEIGGALGVAYLLVVDVAAVGKTFVVNMKLMNVQKADVEARVYETVKGEDDVLIETIKRALTRLLQRGNPASTAQAPESVVTHEPTPSAAPVAAPAASPGPSTRQHHFGLMVGAGRSWVKISAEGTDTKSSGNALPILELYYDGPHLEVRGSGGPSGAGLLVGGLRLGIKAGERWSLGGELVMLDAIDTFATVQDSHMGIGSIAFGASFAATSRVKLAAFVGTPAFANIDRPTSTTSSQYHASGTSPFVHAEAQLTLTANLWARLAYMDVSVDGTSDESSATLRGRTQALSIGLGYDMAPLFD